METDKTFEGENLNRLLTESLNFNIIDANTLSACRNNRRVVGIEFKLLILHPLFAIN